MVAQRQIPVSPFDIGIRTLKNLRELFGLLSEVPLGLGTQLTQGSIRHKQWGAKTVSECPKRLARPDRESMGHTLEIIGWNEPGGRGEGYRLGQVHVMDLLPHVP
jgi:hypothetical protein